MSESGDRWTFKPESFSAEDGTRYTVEHPPPREWTAEEIRADVEESLLSSTGFWRRLWWRVNPRAFRAAVAAGIAVWKPPWKRVFEAVQAAGVRAQQEEARITGLLIGKPREEGEPDE